MSSLLILSYNFLLKQNILLFFILTILYLLNGDIETWDQRHDMTSNVPEILTTDYVCRRQIDNPLISAVELEKDLDNDTVIVDTRDPDEYDTVHLPQAVNFQWRDLVMEEPKQLKPWEEIESILKNHGIVPNKPIRLYCNTARRLSFVYAVLRDLGFEDVAIYEGGIKAWAEFGGPVETTLS